MSNCHEAITTLCGGSEELFPIRKGAFDAAHEPRCSPWRARRCPQIPAHFGGRSIAFEVVAPQAACDQVLPTVLAAARARKHMVDRVGGSAAVPAAVIVASKHTSTRHRNVPSARDSHVIAQDDHRWALPRPGRAPDRILAIGGDDGRLLVHHEHERSFEGHDRERLVSGIQN